MVSSNVGSGGWSVPPLITVTTGAAIRLLAARTDRWGADIQNPDTTDTLWIGPTNAVAIGNGWPIAPGQDFPLRTIAEVWGIAQGGSISAAVLEIF